MPKNPIFARLFVAARTHPKLWPRSDSAVRLHWDAVMWSRENLTDGHIPRVMLAAISPAKNQRRCIAELVAFNVWEETESGFQIHDWKDSQETKAQVEARSLERSQSGLKGASSRWNLNGNSYSESHT